MKKPCPFCQTNDLKVQEILGRVWVSCQGCGVSGPDAKSDNEAWRVWNYRTTYESPPIENHSPSFHAKIVGLFAFLAAFGAWWVAK